VFDIGGGSTELVLIDNRKRARCRAFWISSRSPMAWCR
jgi:exopolyphosphatase/pppGpp-phosphohydrolase